MFPLVYERTLARPLHDANLVTLDNRTALLGSGTAIDAPAEAMDTKFDIMDSDPVPLRIVPSPDLWYALDEDERLAIWRDPHNAPDPNE
ncbi:hypothetical protein GGF32_009503 [Allomyces javanicus]|nr:hypothetical protein GGF32_009503 [Allomyces javanicus]